MYCTYSRPEADTLSYVHQSNIGERMTRNFAKKNLCSSAMEQVAADVADPSK